MSFGFSVGDFVALSEQCSRASRELDDLFETLKNGEAYFMKRKLYGALEALRHLLSLIKELLSEQSWPLDDKEKDDLGKFTLASIAALDGVLLFTTWYRSNSGGYTTFKNGLRRLRKVNKDVELCVNNLSGWTAGIQR
jgi:hypothetical protein